MRNVLVHINEIKPQNNCNYGLPILSVDSTASRYINFNESVNRNYICYWIEYILEELKMGLSLQFQVHR